ncbi:Sphingomyelin phosphodiesterase 4 [Geodia barretti]|uniref:Sphingomyelin phosphodiesterase 4 n=1 Tax=Geodia barretti TaxID=519541 RepID=A0AA35WNG8_GEOBA|nr:Sphingomyelin phosphodiesterase 4 [Geodia barretti]
MLAALQGKATSPTHLNPYSGLSNPRFTARCSHIQSCIDLLPLKDLHEFFPHLLANVFGYDHSQGWQLRGFNAKLHSDFPTLLNFFSPDGHIFRLMGKLESTNSLYEFPISCLPTPTQLSLTEGHVPHLYHDKVDHISPTKLHLTAFEYYIFHFAYYLIFQQTKPQPAPTATPLQDCIYSHLLDVYLNHFLPPLGTLPPALMMTSKQQGSPHHHGYTPPGYISCHPGELRAGGGTEAHAEEREAPLVQAEVLVQVLVEFWLNQNKYNGRHGDILAQAQNRFVPNEEHLLLTRRLVRHVHYFTNGSASGSPYNFLNPLTDDFRRSIIPTFIHKRLYYFLRYSFRHLPLDNTFRYVLELWLTYIQPWRYTDPLRPSSENKESLESLPRRWKAFVLDNFPFYSTLLTEIIGRSFQMDLTSDPGIVLLYRVTKVFTQPGLMDYINYGECLLVDSDLSYSSPGNTPAVDACSLKALFMELDGPLFTYQPLLQDNNTLSAVQLLVEKVQEARGMLSSRLNSSENLCLSQQQSSPPPPPLTPITPTSPVINPSNRWWKSVGGLFSVDGGSSPAPSPPSHPTSDLGKLQSLLETTQTNLITMFGISSPPKLSPTDSSPQWHQTTPPSLSPLRLAYSTTAAAGHTPFPETPKSLEPEYVRGTAQLTPRGKMQLIQGSRKSSNLKVPYLGDPLLQPVRSYENTTLVRVLHSCSLYLNERPVTLS